jgi:hypothetical protein
MKTKQCTKCLVFKGLDDFYRRGESGRKSECKDCDNQRHTKWRAKDPERTRRLWREAAQRHAPRARLRIYGLTETEFEVLLKSQGGLCAICRSDGDLCIDHDHSSGKVRGLLCSNCNSMLGMGQDDPARLELGAEYLRNSK